MSTAKRLPSYAQLDAMRQRLKTAFFYLFLPLILGIIAMRADQPWLAQFGSFTVALSILAFAICLSAIVYLQNLYQGKIAEFVRTHRRGDHLLGL